MPSTILLFGLLFVYIAITGRFIAFLNGAKAVGDMFKLSAGAKALDPDAVTPTPSPSPSPDNPDIPDPKGST